MTLDAKWRILQLFGGEGAGAGSAGAGGTAGDGGAGAAASGDGTADAAQRLREMGVPESKIAKYGKAYANRAKKSAVPPAAEHQKTDDNQQAAAAKENAQEVETEQKNGKPKYDWDEVMKDPEMNRRMQETVRMSKKKSQAAEDALAALAPALKAQAQEYGLDPENIDYVALGKHMSGEYDSKALELGLPRETVVKMDQQQRINEEQLNRQHIMGLIEQGEKMKTVFPNFDLRKEMENPQFRRLTARGVNVSVEDAYHIVHRRELELAQAQIVDRKATERVQNTIRAGQARPDESGASSQASTVTTVDWKHATPEQLKAQAKRIRLAAAQGRKLRPGE